MRYLTKLVVVFLLSMITLNAATLTVSEDATVRGGIGANSNYGSGRLVESVGAGDGEDDWRKGYLLFDASALPPLTGIENLTMTFVGRYNRSGTFYLLVGEGATDWVQSTITWNTAPGNDVRSGRNFGTDKIKAIPLGTVSGATPSGTASVLSFDAASEGAKLLLNALNTGNRKATIVFALSSRNRSFNIASIENPDYAAASLTYMTATAAAAK